eukprot:TRINITY_DN2897_c0_g2_i1.p1 TRINITY_DN2897_c0_g2~~TRINITY_DN2897_c0_g2_i1.p1  ORF type:complete len:791 (+),score=228.89 TRINITY_DN2897_c0_g2_i1:2547-4919(+)
MSFHDRKFLYRAMGGCCSGSSNEGLGPDEDNNAELGELMRLGQEEGNHSCLQLIIRCRNLKPLPNRMGMGKFGGTVPTHLLTSVNSFVVAYELDDKGNIRTELGRTEVKHRDLNPHFVRTVNTVYEFNAMTKEIRFDLFDSDGSHATLLGSATVTLSDIINNQPLTEELTKSIESRGRNNEPTQVVHNAGTLIITSEEISKTEGPQYEAVMKIGCSQLDSKNYVGAGASDPFLTIGRVIEGQFQTVVKTEYVEGTLACEWKTIVVKLEKLCKGDFNAWLLFEVWDYENSGRHQLIGYTRQTLASLLSGVHTEYDLLNDNYLGSQRMTINGKVPYERSGVLTMKSISIDVSHSFLEFVKAGFDINVTICVDFSKSNGTLHELDSGGDNEYISALRSVVKVLGQYDKDQMFPVYGFGACRVDDEYARDEKNNPVPENIFPVTGNWNEVTVNGIDGVIDGYMKCLRRIMPCEPTRFGHCLGNIFRANSSRKDVYQIALIVTDGKCDDINDTIDVIVACSEAPISIIIIGVGEGPFDDMRMLSADDKPLRSSTKETMKRDIVGFVPYQLFKHDADSFARETLKEIPKQFTSWAKIHKVKPEDAKRESEEKARQEMARRLAEKRRAEELENAKRKSWESNQRMEQDLEGVEEVDEVGWESFSDDESGRRYYYNAETKESRWEMPEGYKGKSAALHKPTHEVKVRPLSSQSSRETESLIKKDIAPEVNISPTSSKLSYTRLGTGPQQRSKGRHDSHTGSPSTYVPPIIGSPASYSPASRRGSTPGFPVNSRRLSLK